MDYHPSKASQNSSPSGAEPVLDSVTEELKVEFARLEQIRRLEASAKALEETIKSAFVSAKRGNVFQGLRDALTGIDNIVTAIQKLILVGGDTPGLQQKLAFWTAAYKSTRDTLAKLRALLARSLRATLRTPLLLDGPELSGYKHRLR